MSQKPTTGPDNKNEPSRLEKAKEKMAAVLNAVGAGIEMLEQLVQDMPDLDPGQFFRAHGQGNNAFIRINSLVVGSTPGQTPGVILGNDSLYVGPDAQANINGQKLESGIYAKHNGTYEPLDGDAAQKETQCLKAAASELARNPDTRGQLLGILGSPQAQMVANLTDARLTMTRGDGVQGQDLKGYLSPSADASAQLKAAAGDTMKDGVPHTRPLTPHEKMAREARANPGSVVNMDRPDQQQDPRNRPQPAPANRMRSAMGGM